MSSIKISSRVARRYPIVGSAFPRGSRGMLLYWSFYCLWGVAIVDAVTSMTVKHTPILI
ncbi:hypothetical protein U3516DRAFT_760942 [Neocallimastix sp. 'constans']